MVCQIDTRLVLEIHWDSHLSSLDISSSHREDRWESQVYSSWHLVLTGEGEEVYFLSQSDIQIDTRSYSIVDMEKIDGNLE